MKRRDFLKTAGSASLLGAGSLLTACGRNGDESSGASSPNASSRPAKKTYEWKMVTTWPKNFPGLGTGAEFLAQRIEAVTGGRIRIRVYGGGEMVPALEAFDAVSRGTAEMGHGASYYWKNKAEAAQFFSAVPFGMNAQEMNGWLYHGGGLELWRKVYSNFGLVPFPAGNTGVQMGGWFNKEINGVADLKGLKMRIPGLGSEVLSRAGGSPVLMPGAELFTSLKQGTIDATEWVGPYNDLAFGLHQAARYYYYPGWHEPGSTLECFINQQAWDSLDGELQEQVAVCCGRANQDMLAEYTARNPKALDTLINEHGVDLRPFPDEVLKRLGELSREVVADVADKNAETREVYDSYMSFLKAAREYHDVSERAYFKARAL